MSEKKPAPALWLWNGIGLRLVGRRDYDSAHDSWVATRCFCLFYVPLLALDAYRVSEAGDGWTFHAKASLSPLAWSWNGVLLLACAWVGYWGYQRTQGVSSAGVAAAGATSPQRSSDQRVSLSDAEIQALYPQAMATLGTVFRELLAEEFDMEILKPQGHPLLLLIMAYDDVATQKKLAERLRGNSSFVQALSQLEQIAHAAAQDTNAPMVCFLLHTLLQDQTALQRHAARLQRPWPLQAVPTDLRATYQGERDETNRRQVHAQLDRQTAALTPARQSAKKKTPAVILKEMARLRMQLHNHGEAVNADEIMVTAEGAVQLAPSVAARDVLLDAVCLRLHLRLMEKDKEYAAFAAPLRRSVAPRHLLAFGLAKQVSLRAAVQNDPDMQRIVTMLQDHARRFPRGLSVSGWALLRHVDPTTATAWAQELRQDALGKLERQLWLHLNPWTTPALLNAYWALVLEGKDGDAADLLRLARDQGVPLPQ